uniref:Uncharacterized protein n=1 Tax=Oncorhynchus kisutch TaxID=8019 RepID=A0A8C7IXJ8_ONCKI
MLLMLGFHQPCQETGHWRDYDRGCISMSTLVNYGQSLFTHPCYPCSIKADILFAPSWKSSATVEDPYAIMPPLEQFMAVSFEERRNLLYMERGDIVISRINSIRDFGFFRDIEDLELTALCPLRNVPSNSNHDDLLFNKR